MRTTNTSLTFIAVLVSMFMSAMEATVIATAMPTIVADLGGLELYGWVGGVYLLVGTVTTPLYGKLSDVYGRKPLMLVAIGSFLAGSVASGLAWSMPSLIVMRGVQGLGAGALQSLGSTILGDIYAPQQRARLQGHLGLVWAAAGGLGPLLGGALVTAFTWRSIFFVHVPFGIAAAVLIVKGLHENVERKPVRLDYLGALLLTVAVVCTLLAFRGTALLLNLAVGAVALVAFVFNERVAASPVLPLGLVRRRVIATTAILFACMSAGSMSTITFLPLYLQSQLQLTSMQAGATLTPMLLGWPLAAFVSGRLLVRTSYRTMIASGWFLAAASAIGIVILISAGAPANAFRVAMFFLGAGFGLQQPAGIVATQESVGWQERGVATSTVMFVRAMGASIAVGALGILLARSIEGRVPPSTVESIVGFRKAPIDPAVLAGARELIGSGLFQAFGVVAAVCVVAFVVALSFPPMRMGDGAKKKDGTVEPAQAAKHPTRAA